MFFGNRSSKGSNEPRRVESISSRTSSGQKSENSRKAEVKTKHMQSPTRFNMNRRSAKDNRPKSEYSDKRHQRANLRKSRSVEKLHSPIIHQSDHPAATSKSRFNYQVKIGVISLVTIHLSYWSSVCICSGGII